MKTKTRNRLICTILVILTLLPCIYIFQEGHWDVQKVLYLVLKKLGFLFLSILFIVKIYRLYKDYSWGVLRKIWGWAIIIFVGGGWVLELSLTILGSTLKAAGI